MRTMPDNMPRDTSAPMRAEHLWRTERPRPRSTASRAPARPRHGSHAWPVLSMRVCGLFLESKMHPRNGLRQRVQQVSIAKALSAGNIWATERPPRARYKVSEVQSVLWGLCGLYGMGCAASRAPYSLHHFYTYWLTCISSMTAASMDITAACRGGPTRPPRHRSEHASSEPKRAGSPMADLRPPSRTRLPRRNLPTRRKRGENRGNYAEWQSGLGEPPSTKWPPTRLGGSQRTQGQGTTPSRQLLSPCCGGRASLPRTLHNSCIIMAVWRHSRLRNGSAEPRIEVWDMDDIPGERSRPRRSLFPRAGSSASSAEGSKLWSVLNYGYTSSL